jgi:hypothetical protein
MQNGIWKRVIKDKYFPHISVTTWLRSSSPVSSFGSQTWKNLLNTLPLIMHWLAWKPGSGDSIIVGKDELLGLGKDSILSADLISYLNNKNVYFLYQASRVSPQGSICSNWLDSSDLGLEGDLAAEWEWYRRSLIGSGIQLTKERMS